MTIEHKLKSWPELFRAAVEGRKTHDLRVHDRNFQPGDVLVLQEFNPANNSYTGNHASFEISYVTSSDNPCALSDNGLQSNYCILSIKPLFQ